MKTALWWIRRDMRLSDSPALSAAMKHAGQVIPIFLLDPKLLGSSYASEKRLAFLYDGLRELNTDLERIGSYLVLRKGDPTQILASMLDETGAEAIFAEADYSPYARRRDRTVASQFPLRLSEGLTVHPVDAVLKSDGTPYTVFTPYSKAWLARPWTEALLPAPVRIATPSNITSEGIPASPIPSIRLPFRAGEAAAQARLADFSAMAISRYREERDRMDLTGTSGLSPYLRFGMLSARQAAAAARQAESLATDSISRRGAETWLNELIWREFYISILYHFPDVRRQAFRPAMREIRWMNDREDFRRWTEGQTGYPIVDAAMRQLVSTGWMHNRARMITASFLTKDLLIDWRWGEKFFMQHLIDGDPAANNGGWQWSAGTGTDAAPYFRIFNPVMQSAKFDPNGDYIRRYVPELEHVPGEYIHQPWEMPAALQKQSGCQIGKDYPSPIVDHHMARERALLVYKQ